MHSVIVTSVSKCTMHAVFILITAYIKLTMDDLSGVCDWTL